MTILKNQAQRIMEINKNTVPNKMPGFELYQFSRFRTSKRSCLSNIAIKEPYCPEQTSAKYHNAGSTDI